MKGLHRLVNCLCFFWINPEFLCWASSVSAGRSRTVAEAHMCPTLLFMTRWRGGPRLGGILLELG